MTAPLGGFSASGSSFCVGVPLSVLGGRMNASAGLNRYASADDDVGRHLPQRADVVEHPEPAAVRRDDQIVVVEREVAHRARAAG